MFDFIRKPEVWSAWRDGLAVEIGHAGGFELKTMQDIAVYRRLKGFSGARIAEIGAGHSRVVAALAERNECITVERFKGQGGGPTEERNPPGVSNVNAFLGDHDPALHPSSIDAVYSISVVEHVPDAEALAAFHTDQLRILRTGGIFIHAIDIYLADAPDQYQESRFEAYRRWVAASTGVEPLGEVYEGPFRFSCDLASNPDNVLYSWGSIAPALDSMRQSSQSVSLIVGGRKVAVSS